MPKSTLLKRFLIWRIKHLSHKQFVYLVSIIVGFMSGVGAVVFKNGTHFPVISNGIYYSFVSKSKLLMAYKRKLIDFSGK